MILDEEVYLEHYGVKGMKWGVRKSISERRAANRKKYGGRKRSERTSAQKRARIVRNNNRMVKTFATASVALFIADIFAGQKSKQRPRPNLNDYKRPSNSVQDIINRERKVKIDAIEKTFREGFLDEAQRKQFTDSMNKRYDRKIKEALG